jgi:hypothetical protein
MNLYTGTRSRSYVKHCLYRYRYATRPQIISRVCEIPVILLPSQKHAVPLLKIRHRRHRYRLRFESGYLHYRVVTKFRKLIIRRKFVNISRNFVRVAKYRVKPKFRETLTKFRQMSCHETEPLHFTVSSLKNDST